MSEICGRCKKPSDQPRYSLCRACMLKSQEEYRAKTAYRRANQLCIRCGEPLQDTDKFATCEPCLQSRRHRKKPDESWIKPVKAKPISAKEKRKREKEKKRILEQCAKEGISYGKYMAREYLRSQSKE